VVGNVALKRLFGTFRVDDFDAYQSPLASRAGLSIKPDLSSPIASRIAA
jgi:hypothetical protein